MPAHTYALPFIPCCDVVADGIDASGDFVPRHTRILKSRPYTVFDQHIAVANTAGFNLHAHLSGARLRNIAFYQFPISAWSTYLSCFHYTTLP
jgi:hypothetical protein